MEMLRVYAVAVALVSSPFRGTYFDVLWQEELEIELSFSCFIRPSVGKEDEGPKPISGRRAQLRSTI
jgi:hypothetical protein